MNKKIAVILFTIAMLLTACNPQKSISDTAIVNNPANSAWNSAISFMCQPEMGATSSACK